MARRKTMIENKEREASKVEQLRGSQLVGSSGEKNSTDSSKKGLLV